jgi:hypothetical protein
MAKANQAYHKRDLYSDVTARILAELGTPPETCGIIWTVASYRRLLDLRGGRS